MIAVPINTLVQNVKSSKLFSNVSMFAIYKPQDESFFYVNNPVAGDGVQTAEQLKQWGVKQLAFSYMSQEPFNTLCEAGVELYHIGKEPMPLPEIIQNIQNGLLQTVDMASVDNNRFLGLTATPCSA